MILIQENAQSPWRGGVIRWIKQSSEKSLELGLEVWHKTSTLVPRIFGLTRNTTNHQPALLVQTTQLDQVLNHAYFAGCQLFREKQTIHLRLGKEDLKSLT